MSTRHAILVLAESDNPAARGRMVHALHLARELRDAGCTVKLVLGGQGVTWAGFFTAERAKGDDAHPYARKYGHLFHDADVVVCNMCARRFDVHDAVCAAGFAVDGEGQEHLRLGALVAEGYQVTTF